MLPIHNHSEYSALDGFGTVSEIAGRVESLGLHGCGLTDHGVLAGLIPFYDEMKGRQLVPVLGMEAYQALHSRTDRPKDHRKKGKPKVDEFHLILLAKTTEGYHNLLRLSDEANRSGFYYNPRVDWELLERYHEGLICTSACMGGLIQQHILNGREDELRDALNRYQNIFKDDFYIEIHTYDSDQQRAVNDVLEAVCKSRSIEPLVANDAHYPTPAEHEAQQLMSIIGKHDDGAGYEHPNCLYIMDEDDVRGRLLSHLPESFVELAIANTDSIMEQCKDVKLPEPGRHLPVYFRDGVDSNNSFLIDLVIDGLKKKGLWSNLDYIERAETEINVILEAGLGDYFLIVWDFINWARDHDIMVGPGRGSAGGSLVAYALGITTIDPIKYGLFFERFYNKGREKGLPDIDVDFPWAKRGLVKEYLAKKWGEKRVLSIGNHIRLRPKLAIERLTPALKVDFTDSKAIKSLIDSTTDAGNLAGWDKIEKYVGDDLRKYREKYPKLFEHAETMTDRMATYGIHASAIVISDVDLDGLLPLRRAEDKESGEKLFVTQHEMKMIERLGFPKFDILGIKTLDVLEKTAELAGYEGFKYEDIDFDSLPPEFWQLPEQGLTLGLFQIEQGHGARKIAKQLHARTIDDLGLIVALNRPGPLRSGATDRYLQRRAGEIDVQYPDLILKDTLNETLGEIIFQEQVIQYAGLIGYDLLEADNIRSILGKKKGEAMKAMHPDFIKRQVDHGLSEAKAESIWNLIVNFSEYGFNKSHSVAYGTILAWTMYAKWRWPQEFIMASIIVRPKLRGEYISEARRMGFDVRGPNVNVSDVTISRYRNDLYMGLSEIKYVGKDAARWIIENRPYTSRQDLMNKHAAAQRRWEMDERPPSMKGKSPRQRCNSRVFEMLEDAGALDGIMDRDIEDGEKVRLEEDLLGVRLTDLYTPIIERNRERFDKLGTYTEVEQSRKEQIRVPGIVRQVRVAQIKNDNRVSNKGDEYAHITIEWEGKELRFACWPEKWNMTKAWCDEGVVGIFTLVTNDKGIAMQKGALVE